MELFKVLIAVIFSMVLLRIGRACPQLEIPSILFNTLEVKGGSTYGCVKVATPGLKISFISLWIEDNSKTFNRRYTTLMMQVNDNGESLSYETNLPKNGIGILAMKPNLKKIGQSTYNFSISVPGGNYTLFCNMELTNLCGEFQINMKIQNDMSYVLKSYPVKVTEYPNKEYIVEEGDEVTLKIQGDVLDNFRLEPAFYNTHWYPVILMKSGYFIPVNTDKYKHLRDNMIRENGTQLDKMKTAVNVFKELKIKFVNFESYICLRSQLLEASSLRFSSCSNIVIKETLGTGVQNVWINTCSHNHLEGYKLSSTDTTVIPLPINEINCFSILATGHPAPYLILKKGSKYFKVPQKRTSIATSLRIPTDESNDYIGEYQVFAGYSRVQKTMKFKTIGFSRVKVIKEFHDDVEEFHMTCTAEGDPLPSLRLYYTRNVYIHNPFNNGTFFPGYSLKPLKEIFPNAQIREQSAANVSLTLEKEDIKKHFMASEDFDNMFGIGCVGQNKFSFEYKFHYFQRIGNGNETILYNSNLTFSEPYDFDILPTEIST